MTTTIKALLSILVLAWLASPAFAQEQTQVPSPAVEAPLAVETEVTVLKRTVNRLIERLANLEKANVVENQEDLQKKAKSDLVAFCKTMGLKFYRVEATLPKAASEPITRTVICR